MQIKLADSPLVSIVTPAYNEEKLLPECIESVLSQSYTNWEYLIVNNCSEDRTLAIAEEYAARDGRIRVVSNSSLLPAVANFNSALRQIRPDSKYAKILFADDWIFPECLERMVSLAEENPSVGIVGAYGHQGHVVLWVGVPYAHTVIGGREICRQRLLGGPYVFGSATSHLFRADLVRSREPFYNEANVHAADSEVCFDLLKICDFGFVHQVLTFSRVRKGSLLQASLELNSFAADTLLELVAFGPHYLTPEEYAAMSEKTIAKYYDFLAASYLQRRGSRFWGFHKEILRKSGAPFSARALMRAFARKIVSRFRLPREGDVRWGL
jgi:glycosyltransferase involved in cell wall biosynthesis